MSIVGLFLLSFLLPPVTFEIRDSELNMLEVKTEHVCFMLYYFTGSASPGSVCKSLPGVKRQGQKQQIEGEISKG